MGLGWGLVLPPAPEPSNKPMVLYDEVRLKPFAKGYHFAKCLLGHTHQDAQDEGLELAVVGQCQPVPVGYVECRIVVVLDIVGLSLLVEH